MGHRCNLVIVENGNSEYWYSNFGATSIPCDMLGGASSAIAYARSLEQREELLDPIWCEGAILINVDQKKALYFEDTGNHYYNKSPKLRQVLLKFIACRWEGWSVRRAEYGWYDIAAELHVPFPSMFQPTTNILDEEELAQRVGIVMWLIGHPIDWKSYRAGPLMYYEEMIVTVVTSSSEAPRDYSVAASLEELLALGSLGIERMANSHSTVPIPNEVFVGSGMLVDFKRCEISVWCGTPIDLRITELDSKKWRGWSIRQHSGGFSKQVESSGRDPTIVALPRALLIEQLAEVFGFNAEDMPEFMVSRLQQLKEEQLTPLFVNPTALSPGKIPNTKTDRLEILKMLAQ